MVTSPKISSISDKADKLNALFLQTALKIKSGQATREDIESGLSGNFRETALGLYEGYQRKGLDGFKSVYQALKKDSRVLQKCEPKILPRYAGTLLSEVATEQIDWLWKPRLALGKLTVLDGDPGLGKSTLTANLIARITSGRPMPDGAQCIRGGAVLISPEDGLADTIKPRLERAGADLTRVSSLSTITAYTEDNTPYQRPFSLCAEDLQLLEMEIERVGAKLVVIDPVMAIMGGKDTYKDNDVRATLAPLQMLIERRHVACIMVRHLTKGRGDNPLMAGNGSIAFIGLARTGLMVVEDKENECIVLAQTKSNIGKKADSLTYTIESDDENGDERPYVVWHGVTDTNTSDLLNPFGASKNTGGNRQKIVDFLKEHKPSDKTVQEIAEALPDITIENLKMTLGRMVKAGEIGKTERGLYHAK